MIQEPAQTSTRPIRLKTLVAACLQSVMIHPVTLFSAVWIFTLGLYSMHLSKLLVFSTSDAARAIAWILLPFWGVWILAALMWGLSPKIAPSSARFDITDPDALQAIERRVNRLFLYWLALTLIEVVFSGGVPLLWLLRGANKDYTKFGLPVIHVFAGSLIGVLGATNVALYLLRGGRRRLAIPAFHLLWGVVIVSRGLIMVTLLEYGILWACLRGIRPKVIFRGMVAAVLMVLMFGYLGDMRGVGQFRKVARPTENYPEWLPSGVLWLYIYISSPLQNLIQTTTSMTPADDLLFPRTLIDVYPTPLRNALFGKDYAEEQASGDLIESSLNVSSAFVGPFRDYGFFGISSYSGVLAILALFAWNRRRRTLRDQIFYAVVVECLILTVFWNFLFYNAFASQFFWIFYIFRSGRFRLLPKPLSALLRVAD